eukprot:scaffold37134_cov18-Tisochrysis_lutea.AAC.1
MALHHDLRQKASQHHMQAARFGHRSEACCMMLDLMTKLHHGLGQNNVVTCAQAESIHLGTPAWHFPVSAHPVHGRGPDFNVVQVPASAAPTVVMPYIQLAQITYSTWGD